MNYIKAIRATYVLQSQQGQLCGIYFLILLLKAVREVASLISLGILFHILAVIFEMISISKCVEWIFDLERQLPHLNPLSANPTKSSNTLKQFVGNLSTNCLSVFDHFVKLALEGLIHK